MSKSVANGRHRASGRYNPLSEIGSILGKSAQPAIKSSAVLAASGGLVAALALPAHAAGPAAAPASTPTTAASSIAGIRGAAFTAAPAVVAPKAVAPLATQTFGLASFTAVAKPTPKPAPAPAPTPIVRIVVSDTASRSSNRSAPSSAPSSGASATSYATAARHAAASGVIAVAQSLLGIYYIYGGSTPAGFDCSGFTSYVFRQVGISLPRTAAQQQASAQRISSPEPGDLIFFGYPAYHVGIYAGGGMMYDSPTTGKTSGLHKIWSGSVSYGRP
ncbi:MAG: NlpC/P60 family protein [Nostocoides sp.]